MRYDHEDNKKIEEILVKEVRGNFGKKKWVKAEIKGTYMYTLYAVCTGGVGKANPHWVCYYQMAGVPYHSL